MKYALLIYTNPAVDESLTPEQNSAVFAEYMAVRNEADIYDGAKLEAIETATTVRAADGQTLVTDGPFADTKEVFGGYFLLEADNLDRAIELAARIPAVRQGGSVEIRPVAEVHAPA